ncbi:MAG: DUF3667 domain-containing protein, partial [Chitinophagaceae bacterium]
MSRLPERPEKKCLNCGTSLVDRYCHHCGQENVEPRTSFGSLFLHFIGDFFHYDSKLLTSLRFLLFKPGFLPLQYRLGKRAGYVDPVRMYLFTSAVFFLILFAVFTPKGFFEGPKSGPSADSLSRENWKDKFYPQARSIKDSIAIDSGLAVLQQVKTLPEADSVLLFDGQYSSRERYDSLQNALPPEKRDHWLERRMKYRIIDLQQQYGTNGKLLLKELFVRFLHLLPYLLFVTLPIYAFYLKLLYIRRSFYYVDHLIFLLYLYIFAFLFLLLFFALNNLQELTGWGIWTFLEVLLLVGGIYYAYRSMRNYYQQSGSKTLLKFFILN